MYIVVSRWAVPVGHREEARARARGVRDVIRNLPGVLDLKHFENEEGLFIAVITYADRSAYARIVEDPSGPFSRALEESGLLNLGVWIGSDRGEAMD